MASFKPDNAFRTMTGTSSLQKRAISKADKLEMSYDDMMKRLTGEPDKLRAFLTHIIAPRFQPTFSANPHVLDDKNADSIMPFEALKPSANPMHMFEVDTMNLCDYPRIGDGSQYCIVSHNWKGSEVNYGDILSARRWAMRDITDAVSKALAATSAESQIDPDDALRQAHKDGKIVRAEAKNDVERIKEKCHHDIKMQVASIYLLVISNPPEVAADFGLSESLSSYEIAQALVELKELCDWKLAETDYNREKFNRLRDTYGEQLEYEEFDRLSTAFRTHHQFREAVEELVSCLQRWRSALKIEQSILQAREIFNRGIFGRGAGTSPAAKRYVWLDTCCIDKSNSAEYSTSISLMGDWYTHAAFCIVLLDTRSASGPEKCRYHPLKRRCCTKECGLYDKRHESATEWSKELDLFQKAETYDKGSASEFIRQRRVRDIHSFPAISDIKPQWAERGWTLQELILSKATFFFNAAWEPLPRPVENLGDYYFLVPFISVYTPEESDTASSWTPELLTKLASDLKYEPKLSSPPFSAVVDLKEHDAQSVYIALHLIEILDRLGVQIPANIIKEDAYNRIVDIIHHAGHKAASDENKMAVLETLLKHLEGVTTVVTPGSVEEAFPYPDGIGEPSTKTKARQTYKAAVDYLLRSLTAVLGQLILKDRSDIAKFSSVKGLEDWCKGTARDKFTAGCVLSLARTRECTVDVDEAYSLMGICRVRFPTFHAEGLSHALARLLDQIVIDHNDVSVFNWSGLRYGSKIRGRSMYPSSLEAYAAQMSKEEEAQRDQDIEEGKFRDESHKEGGSVVALEDDDLELERRKKELLRKDQRRKVEEAAKYRAEVQLTYATLFKLLRETIKLVKKRDKKDMPIEWLKQIIRFVNVSRTRRIIAYLDGISKILKYIQIECATNLDTLPKEEPKSRPELARNWTGSSGSFTINAISNKGLSALNSFTSPRSGISTPEAPGTDAVSEPTQRLKKGSFGLKMPLSPPGFGKFGRDKSSKQELSSPVTPNIESETIGSNTATLQTSESTAIPDNSKSEKGAWKRLNEEVLAFLRYIMPKKRIENDHGKRDSQEMRMTQKEENGTEDEDDDWYSLIGDKIDHSAYDNDETPPGGDVEAALNKLPQDIHMIVVEEEKPPQLPGPATRRGDIEKMVSPNPIIVNNTGIEGIFDIQRVIVHMEDSERLRNVVNTAASRYQIVKGTCSISTGTVVVTVDFSCEAHILENQLNICEVVSSTVTSEKGDAKDEDDKIRETDQKNNKPVKELAGATGVAEEAAEAHDHGGDEDRVTTLQHTRQERMAKRMVRFIEEPDLENVAGEWVVARFSGVPGANWFLCQLDLDRNNKLQGRRIPSEEIDFEKGIPEPVLQDIWLTFLERKKNRYCDVLFMYLASREYQKATKGLQEEAMNKSMDLLRSMLDAGSRETTINEKGMEDVDLNNEAPNTPGDGKARTAGDEKAWETFIDGLESLNRSALMVVGSAFTAMASMAMEQWAERLEKSVAAKALKNSPRKLQPVIDSLDRNGDWLPTVFHGSKTIHIL